MTVTATRTRTRKTVAKGNKSEIVAQGNKCRCSCGETPNTGKMYRPGHDARHAGLVGRLILANSPKADAEFAKLTPKLKEKAQKFVSTRVARAERAEQAKAIRAAAKAETAAKLAKI